MKISDVTLSLASPTENPWPEKYPGATNNVPVWITSDAEEALSAIGRTWKDCNPCAPAAKTLDRLTTPDGWIYCILVKAKEEGQRNIQIYWSRGKGDDGRPETCVLLPSDCADPVQKVAGAVLAAVGARA